MFVILSVIYRPIEQLLSRTIADRQARGESGHILRTPAIIQASFALVFLVVALLLRDTIQNHVFNGSAARSCPSLQPDGFVSRTLLSSLLDQ